MPLSPNHAFPESQQGASNPLPERPPAMTLSMALATWFWCGLSPKAPGTVGSLGALPVAWAVLAFGGGWVWLAVAAAAATVIGTWATAVVLRRCSVKDPGFVVIDEVAGQWIALLPVALFPSMADAPGPDPVLFAGGFIAFRLFDILKPRPS